MSDPTPGGYDPQNPPTRRYGQPPVPQHAPPPAIPPTDPQAGFPDQRPPVNPADPRLAVEAGRFWAGAAATALVAALIGLLGVIIFERIFSITLVPPPDLFGTGSRQAAWAYAQMVRWGQAPLSEGLLASATSVFRPDLYDAALGGGHFLPPGEPADGIGAFAGPAFDPADIAAHLAAWARRGH